MPRPTREGGGTAAAARGPSPSPASRPLANPRLLPRIFLREEKKKNGRSGGLPSLKLNRGKGGSSRAASGQERSCFAHLCKEYKTRHADVAAVVQSQGGGLSWWVHSRGKRARHGAAACQGGVLSRRLPPQLSPRCRRSLSAAQRRRHCCLGRISPLQPAFLPILVPAALPARFLGLLARRRRRHSQRLGQRRRRFRCLGVLGAAIELSVSVDYGLPVPQLPLLGEQLRRQRLRGLGHVARRGVGGGAAALQRLYHTHHIPLAGAPEGQVVLAGAQRWVVPARRAAAAQVGKAW